MRILIAADMEGISGVVHWDQVDAKHSEYARFRKVMTDDVNAAIQGAFEATAEEVLVSDGHGNGRNILVEQLDPRAKLNSGNSSPLAMVQGVAELASPDSQSATMFVGYHARVGSQNAILDHTWSGACVANMWLNGQTVGEIGINAAVCGHYGVPVILCSGDQTACAEAATLLGPLETVEVKQASGRMAAECLPLEVTQSSIKKAARRAVEKLQRGEAPPPFRVEPPITVAIELVSSEMADRAMLLPGIHRAEGKRIEVVADDVPTAYQAMRAAITLAKG
jgi:D-amino peptidase